MDSSYLSVFFLFKQINKEYTRIMGSEQPALGFKRLQAIFDTVKKTGNDY